MGVKIKVCGITSMQEAEELVKLDIDYMGFIFAKSRRKIEREKAREIISFIKTSNPKIKTAGVFVNSNFYEVQELREFCGLDVLQLHGDESYEYCKMCGGEVWKAVSVGDNFNQGIFKQYDVSAFLLDSSGTKRGGNNKTFDWEGLKDIGEKVPIVLAGGLNSDNVRRGLSLIKPAIVDVNSGVEKDGRKNYTLVKEFVDVVRNMEVCSV